MLLAGLMITFTHVQSWPKRRASWPEPAMMPKLEISQKPRPKRKCGCTPPVSAQWPYASPAYFFVDKFAFWSFIAYIVAQIGLAIHTLALITCSRVNTRKFRFYPDSHTAYLHAKKCLLFDYLKAEKNDFAYLMLTNCDSTDEAKNILFQIDTEICGQMQYGMMSVFILTSFL